MPQISVDELASLGVTEVSEKYGLSVRTVWRLRASWGLARPGWRKGKLSSAQADDIRMLYSLGKPYTQKKLGEMYGVSQALIGRVVNNLVHRMERFGLKGESEYSVRYNYIPEP